MEIDYRSMLEALPVKELLARQGYGEARGELIRGILAVMHVALNRAKAPGWWGEDLQSVLLCRKQFSCFNEDDPNCRVLAMMDKSNAPPGMTVCRTLADLVIDGLTLDPTGGATSYHTVDKPPWANQWPPSWAAKMKQTCTIGHHVFYK